MKISTITNAFLSLSKRYACKFGRIQLTCYGDTMQSPGQYHASANVIQNKSNMNILISVGEPNLRWKKGISRVMRPLPFMILQTHARWNAIPRVQHLLPEYAWATTTWAGLAKTIIFTDSRTCWALSERLSWLYGNLLYKPLLFKAE